MLAYCFKKLIESYWKFVPESKRKICLYKLSCSKAVYQKIENEGFWEGVKLYLKRRANCREGYKLFLENKKVEIITIEGELIEESEINTILVKEFKLSQ